MDHSFYQKHKLKSPITKRELDYYDVGQWITAAVIQVEDKSIVVGG
jgi:hypothetical protein